MAVLRPMAFPRSFKRETWYLRLPSGEIEVATATSLQRAFDCGLVDFRTPVRAFGSHTWTTMLEAAKLEVPASPALSLSPIALDTPAADLVEVHWQSRNEVDPKAFKHSRTTPVLVALLASCALAAVALFGDKVPVLASNASMQLEAASVIPVTPREPRSAQTTKHDLESLPTTKNTEPRWTKVQRHRLAELDYVTRTQRPKSSFVKPLLPKPGASEDPFARKSTNVSRRGDPLDGSL
jgi:hypothetical protein